MPQDIIQSVLVVGGGSAGFLAAITLKRWLPRMPVSVLRSEDIPVIGVGEGTTVGFTTHLHGHLGLAGCTGLAGRRSDGAFEITAMEMESGNASAGACRGWESHLRVA